MRNWLMGLILAVVALTAGCSFVLPSHANMIDEHAGNAKAISNLAKLDPNVPLAAKQWFAADANAWQYMSDWAHRRRPAPK